MRKKNKLVQGVGVNDYEEAITVSGKHIDSYSCWSRMLKRCYSSKYQSRNPTYAGCSVCGEWLIFSNFKNWYDINYRVEFELDKDILVEGNKVYSPDTCCFVPQYLNKLLTDRGRTRGDLPVGVSIKSLVVKGKTYEYYRASCNNGYGKQLDKAFKTLEEALHWYSITKTRIVAEQVQRALSEGAIDQRVAKALLARKF